MGFAILDLIVNSSISVAYVVNLGMGFTIAEKLTNMIHQLKRKNLVVVQDLKETIHMESTRITQKGTEW